MNDPGKHFKAVDDTWTGACKIRARINNVDSVVLCRWKRIESREFLEQFVIALGTIDIISAKGQYDDLRPRLHKGLPLILTQPLFLPPYGIVSARVFNQLGSQVPGTDCRFNPFLRKPARPIGN